MKKIEDFIIANRSSFDLKTPKSDIWSRIESKLDAKETIGGGLRVSWPWRSMGIAASIIFLLGVGYFAGRYGRPVADNKDIIAISTKYGTSVVRYETFIDDKRKRLISNSSMNPELLSGFESDLQELNKAYIKMRALLPNHPNQEILLEEMVQNLKWQLELLDLQLNLINKIESNTGSNDESKII